MGIIQGIVFGIIVLYKKKYSSKTTSFLSYTVFSLSFSNLQYWFFDSNLYKYLPFLDWLRIPCEFLIIPMFYLFVINYLELKLSKRIKIILLIPFLFDLSLQILLTINKFIFNNSLFNDNVIYYYLVSEETLSFLYSLILIILTINIVNRYEKLNRSYDVTKVKVKVKWLKQILIIGLIACVFWLLEIYLMKNNSNKETSIYYPIWIIISFIIYWLSYVGLFNSSVYNERKEIRNDLLNSFTSFDKKDKLVNNINQQKIYSEFEKLISNTYMNPNINLEEVANKLNISTNYLSQIINANDSSFNDYLNSIRIEKVKEMLKKNSYSNYTITSIGLEAGFNSNASFYRAFKKHTNMTPVHFRKKT